eukprot:CAMPEP_0202869544 /NCGR_PEP_ID=MMETSP1391-20130828/12514_1 /ASSEMBLY_ACC=CAM_ASM_000867 /TAXON_ID=1034604 /ORGANISM="Chlamydomonas leiostraca, Strain SAG 11-49" /LENGTH=169 /DNA_ID=CAMNT_0049549877 /DNA_START=42 /DNA_END=551 /DNA_ORIENTATION=+
MASLTSRVRFAAPCSSKACFTHSLLPVRPARALVVRAAEQKESGGSSVPDIVKESELEALEASVRGKKAQAPRRQIPIRGVNQPQQQQQSGGNYAQWKENQLFPEGWDNMNAGQKVTEILYGRRGVLFWLNKAAYASVFVLIGGWVLFRFVGPNLGLYTLAGDFVPPPL